MRGVTVIEVAIGVSIAALVLIFSMQSLSLFINVGRTISEKTKAIYLAEDGLEIVRYLRDESWSTVSALSTSGTHYLSVTPGAFSFTSTPETVDGYTRSFKISNVYRNSSDDIVASTTSGASPDTGSKYVELRVVGGTPVATTSISTILTNPNP
jgi:hypothetical protein